MGDYKMNVKNRQVIQLENIMIDNNLFDKYGLKKIGVFGSVARDVEANDIDILVEDDVDFRNLSDFRDELSRFIKKPVDIVMAKYANPIVLYRAKKEIIYVTKH